MSHFDPLLPAALTEYFVREGDTLRADAGQTLITAGDECRDVYLVETGSIRFTLVSETGRESIFSDAFAGSLFGELSAIDGRERSVIVAALEDATLRRLPASKFTKFVTSDPALSLWTMGLLASRVRDMTQRSFELSAMSVGRRMINALLRMTDESADQTRVVIDDFPTHEVFAAMIGSHREAITRELGRLSHLDIVEQKGRRLTIKNRAKLDAL